jgi:hemin uptake protein HemP
MNASALGALKTGQTTGFVRGGVKGDAVPPAQLTAGGHMETSKIKTIPSEVLFEQHQTVHIRHAGENYRLQVTKLGKLILTK